MPETPSIDSAKPPAPSTPSTAKANQAGHVYRYRGEGTGWWQSLSFKLGQIFSWMVTLLLFRLRVSGKENIPRTGGVLQVTNHQSYLDPWIIGIFPPRQVHYMARDTLFRGGFLTLWMEHWNAFPVKRGAADLGAIRAAVERLDKGYLLNIFPEGTRSEDGTIGNIAPGFSLILNRAKTDVSILPTLIDGAFEAWPRKAKLPRVLGGGGIRIRHGKVITAAEWRAMSPEELAVTIRRRLIALQVELGSPHAAASQARLDADLAEAASQPVKARRRADRG